MTSIRFFAAITGAGVLCVSALTCSAEARSNPYVGIVDRNPFGLKPPPPPPTETVEEPAAPPPNVKLTGISNLFSKRALLEITEMQAPARPGQAPPPGGTVNRPILAEGEAMFGVEVVGIDLEKNIVRIRNGGTESELTFEVPKPSATPSPPVGRTAHVAPAVPAMGQPTIVSSSESRGGVTMFGGGGGFAGNTAAASSYGGSSSGVSSYGGTPAPTMAGLNRGLQNIPSRQMRTASVPAPQAVDPDVQQVLMEGMRERYKEVNARQRASGTKYPIQYPPLPPTDLTPHLQGQPDGPGHPQPGGLPAFPGQ